jgi:Arc/MetJ family transcription regulator
MAVGTRKAKEDHMTRTNVVLDDELVREAMELTGIATKRALLEEALRKLIRLKKQERILDLYGTIDWEGDLAEMRKGRSFDADRR